jgi:hypothetical protein
VILQVKCTLFSTPASKELAFNAMIEALRLHGVCFITTYLNPPPPKKKVFTLKILPYKKIMTMQGM